MLRPLITAPLAFLSLALVDGLCPQFSAFTAPDHRALLQSLDREFASTKFKLNAYESLGGAVRIPTESYDDLGHPSEDPRWKVELELHDYLESRFPKVLVHVATIGYHLLIALNSHANLDRITVNTYALLYEWKGTENLKPLLLVAHMDVVPVNYETLDEWIYPPYSGYYDGEWIWGRGSGDDKPGVIASLTAVESLLERGFVPSRTILLAFGTDEECGGRQGAAMIAKHLLSIYGPDSMAMVVDEGGQYINRSGVVFASPAVAERGYIDIRLDILTPGGHSGLPPKHTGIGILADLITTLEAHPHPLELIRGRTSYQGLECRARYDPGFPAPLKELVLESQTSDVKLRELQDRILEFDPSFHSMSGTTQAVDLIGGGVNANTLPETAWAIVNHRIADHGSPARLIDRFINIILPVAVRYNMTVEAFGETVGSQGSSWGELRLSDSFNSSLTPAPVTPTTSGPYQLLSGTIRSTIQTHLRTDSLPKSVIVSPSLSIGNTDTKHYWNLTKYIFRYGHRGATDIYGGVHTVNEAIRAEAFLEQIRFFTRLILNSDRSDLLD